MFITALALLSLSPSQLPRKEAVPAVKAAQKFRYTVTPEMVQHLGSVGPKEVKSLQWTLKNTSAKPITFRVLDTAPGVKVSPEPFSKPWQPGEAREIKLTSDPSNFLAYQRRAVRLEPDDFTQPRYILRWDMTVRPEMSVDATNKDFGEVARAESPLVTYVFTREGGDPAEIRLTSKLPGYLEAEASAAGPRASLQIIFRPSKLQPGMVSGLELLKVTTNAPMQPSFDLTLAWKLNLPILASPSRLVWDDPKIRELNLTLKSKNGKPFRILEARIEGPKDKQGHALFTHGGLPAMDAPSHILTLRCSSELQAQAMLSLTCSGQDEPLQVPLSWLPPKETPAPARPPANTPESEQAPRH